MITRVNNKEVEVQCANYEICGSWFTIKDLEVKTWDVCKKCDLCYNTRLYIADHKKCNLCFKIKRCVSIPSSSNYLCINHFKLLKQ
jgi:hypothetical protein